MLRRLNCCLPHALLVTLLGGCSQLPENNFGLGLLTPKSNKSVAANNDEQLRTDQVLVQFVSQTGGVERKRINIRPDTLVSELLRQTDALDEFRHSQVFVLRRSPTSAGTARMEVKIDPKLDRATPGSDYALKHGDIIEIHQRSAAWVSNMLGVFGRSIR